MKLVKFYEVRVGDLVISPTITQWGAGFYLRITIQKDGGYEPTVFDVPLDEDISPPFVVVHVGEKSLKIVLKEKGDESPVLYLEDQSEKIKLVLDFLKDKEMITKEELNLLKAIK